MTPVVSDKKLYLIFMSGLQAMYLDGIRITIGFGIQYRIKSGITCDLTWIRTSKLVT